MFSKHAKAKGSFRWKQKIQRCFKFQRSKRWCQRNYPHSRLLFCCLIEGTEVKYSEHKIWLNIQSRLCKSDIFFNYIKKNSLMMAVTCNRYFIHCWLIPWKSRQFFWTLFGTCLLLTLENIVEAKLLSTGSCGSTAYKWNIAWATIFCNYYPSWARGRRV